MAQDTKNGPVPAITGRRRPMPRRRPGRSGFARTEHVPSLSCYDGRIAETKDSAVARMLVAVLGAAAVTVVLLLAMNDIVSRFTERDGKRYFLVDFIEPVETGRQRVQRLQVPEAATGRARPETDVANPRLPVRPDVEGIVITPPPAAAIELDPATVEPESP